MGDLRIAVVMPAYNEAGGIGEFLHELAEGLGGHDVQLVVVDDASRDHTREAVLRSRDAGVPVELHANASNSGHGPTTLRALRAGLALEPDLVVAVDGDGQFFGADVRRLVELAQTTGADVVEGVRTSRADPLFRRTTSAVTRQLVRRRAGVAPRDANTPLRVYRPDALRGLLVGVPDHAMTPNLVFSVLSRRQGLELLEQEVRSRPGRGVDPAGSSWGSSLPSLPSRRFVRFCVDAARQWRSMG